MQSLSLCFPLSSSASNSSNSPPSRSVEEDWGLVRRLAMWPLTAFPATGCRSSRRKSEIEIRRRDLELDRWWPPPQPLPSPPSPGNLRIPTRTLLPRRIATVSVTLIPGCWSPPRRTMPPPAQDELAPRRSILGSSPLIAAPRPLRPLRVLPPLPSLLRPPAASRRRSWPPGHRRRRPCPSVRPRSDRTPSVGLGLPRLSPIPAQLRPSPPPPPVPSAWPGASRSPSRGNPSSTRPADPSPPLPRPSGGDMVPLVPLWRRLVII